MAALLLRVLVRLTLLVTWLSPPKGHTSGGTTVTIYGSGFLRTSSLTVRFATELEIHDVAATFVSSSVITTVTPSRSSTGTAQVTVANDGITFSAYPLLYVKGAGSAVKFLFDNSNPGCLDCLNSAFYNATNTSVGLNPLYIPERWATDNSSGPYIGGTLVTITAVGLAWPAGVTPYDLSLAPGSPQRYNGPTGGPGSPNPFNVDPTAVQNGPPVTGTFYPGVGLACIWRCAIDLDQNVYTGSAGGVTGADLLVTTVGMAAEWLGYRRVRCVSPRMPVPSRPGLAIGDTNCTILVTNNNATVDTQGGAAAWFVYQDRAPTVTHIATAQTSPWPARGPFMGNTEVLVTGTNFLPSAYLKCKFGGLTTAAGAAIDDVSHVVGEAGGKVRYISSTQIACVSPVFGPASQAEQYPPGSLAAVGAGAALEVTAWGGAADDAIAAVAVVSGGRGYKSPPVVLVSGGGGCCAAVTVAVDPVWGTVVNATVVAGGYNYNRGTGAAATALLSNVSSGLQVVTAVVVTAGGSQYATPPQVLFSCDGGGTTCFARRAGALAVAQQHARASAVLGWDPSCTYASVACAGRGTLVRVDVTFGGAFYTSPPLVSIVPAPPTLQVVAREAFPTYPGSRNRLDPPLVGGYSKQGKYADELDPEGQYGNFPNGGSTVASLVPNTDAVEFERYPNGSFRIPAGGDDAPCYATCPPRATLATDWQSCARCPQLASPESRGGLLPPLGRAWTDGSIKPGHQALVRVSNNYDKFGGGVQAAAGTSASFPWQSYVGYRNLTDGTGYWLWSLSGFSAAEMDRCRVSNNPPVMQFGSEQGHGTDALLGLGSWSDDADVGGVNSGFTRVDGGSVLGAPGANATAVALLSADDDTCAAALACAAAATATGRPPGSPAAEAAVATAAACPPLCSVAAVVVTNPGQGYNGPPTVMFSGGGGSADGAQEGHGASAVALVSGGTVIAVNVTAGGTAYATAPAVFIVAAEGPLQYDGAADAAWHYIAPGALTYGGLNSTYAWTAGVAAPDTVGHGEWNLDQSTLSVFVGPARAVSNLEAGHGAFPGSPANENLGHPKADCIYFFYGDIYVSPSGDDATGQGTAARPYRTIQKCIDAALTGARDYGLYKLADGGDPDRDIPGSEKANPGLYPGGARLGYESAGERPDMTAPGQNLGTPWSQGYTGRPVTVRNGRVTNWYSGGSPGAAGRAGGSGDGHDTAPMTRGLQYTVNRDRCVLKDGVYAGAGNRWLAARGRVVEVFAENAGAAVVDCGGMPLAQRGGAVTPGQASAGPVGADVGSISLHGVAQRNCELRADAPANYRPYYPGRPGFGPGVRAPSGALCTPGATGCQAQRPPDGMAAGFP